MIRRRPQTSDKSKPLRHERHASGLSEESGLQGLPPIVSVIPSEQCTQEVLPCPFACQKRSHGGDDEIAPSTTQIAAAATFPSSSSSASQPSISPPPRSLVVVERNFGLKQGARAALRQGGFDPHSNGDFGLIGRRATAVNAEGPIG